MTTDEMRKYLESHVHLDNKIIAIGIEIEQISQNQGREPEINRLKEELSQLNSQRKEIRKVIFSLNDYDIESFIIMRYINHYTAEQIAEEFGCSPRTVYNKINKGLSLLCSKFH